MRATAVAILSALLISTIVSKKEMCVQECPNWVQFSATEIEAAHRLKNK